MNPVDQTILNDPDNGVYGDCQRACIASLLEMDPYDIPHFNEKNDDIHFNETLNGFLGSLGYFHLISNTFSFYTHQKFGAVDCYHLIYGKTERGTQHAVVGLNGKMVHDPHPSRAGLLDSDKDNWAYAFLVSADAAVSAA